MTFLDAIEEDQNKYDMPSREDDLETAKPTFKAGLRQSVEPGSVPKLQRATSVLEGRSRPTVPMPGSVVASKSASDILAVSLKH